MKKMLAILALCMLAMTTSYADDITMMGTWKLNEAKSKFPAAAGKSTTVVYAPAGDMIKVTTDGVDGSGKPAHTEWTGKLDGKPYPVTGAAYDARAVTQKGDRMLEGTTLKDGKTVGTFKVELAKDGKTRTLETEGTSPDGKKYKAHYFYDKE